MVVCPKIAYQRCPAPKIGPEQADVPTTEVEDAHNRALWLICAISHEAAVDCLEARDRALAPDPEDK